MLKVAEIIRAEKSDVKIGPWKSGKVPAYSFPIAKQKRLPQGNAWTWRVVEFYALTYKFRLLIRLNIDISYYSSILALENEGKNKIICHHEMHQSHRNWHCHFINGNVHETCPGVLRDFNKMRVYESEPSKAKDAQFEVVQSTALAIAANRFRFSAPDENPAQWQLI